MAPYVLTMGIWTNQNYVSTLKSYGSNLVGRCMHAYMCAFVCVCVCGCVCGVCGCVCVCVRIEKRALTLWPIGNKLTQRRRGEETRTCKTHKQNPN